MPAPKDNKKGLTDKQRAFCSEYIKDWNGTRAAIVAGYSENSASETAYENLRKPQIQDYISKIKENIEQEAGISKLGILLEHKKIAYSSIAHLHNTWIEKKAFEDLTDDQKSCIAEIQTRKRVIAGDEDNFEIEEVKIKLYDKQKSLDAISKLMGYDAPQKHDISGKIDAPTIIVADSKTAKRINEL